MKRLVKNARQIVGAGDPIVVLGDGESDAGDVGLLERIFPQHRARYLTRDRDQGRAIHPRVGDRSNQIRRAGSAGGDADTDLSGGAGVTFRSVPSALFVAAENVAQLIAIFPQRVIEGHYRAAGNAEHHLDILAHERFAHHLGSGALVRRGAGSGRREAGVGHVLTPAVGL